MMTNVPDFGPIVEAIKTGGLIALCVAVGYGLCWLRRRGF